ncbi:MAG: hypothetical protein HFE63_05630 [Clostridiales bacterium]|nr:hypothetical protein [Clostridiales bacterium]
MTKRNIILGTDWGTDCDDVAAVRIACRSAKAGVWNVVGVVLNNCVDFSAPSIDGFIRSEGFEVPIGIDFTANDFGGVTFYQKHLNDIVTGRGIAVRANNDCESGVRLYRKLLSEAEDDSVELADIGFLQVVADLFESGADDISDMSGAELMEKKVKRLWSMSGDWKNEASGREYNINCNHRTIDGACRLINNYPGEIVFLGHEVGASVITHPNPVEGDLLYEAFKAHGSASGRSSWDPMLVLLAAGCPNASDDEFEAAGYRTVRGTATVDEDGCNHFVRSSDGRHRYVVKLKPDEWYSAAIDDMIK